MVSPPPISPSILAAADELGIREIYQIGGAQAIAALAYGTESVPRVDKIVGPGNIYVMAAKKLLFGEVGIESLAGPSDVLIIADEDSEAEYIAADLLAQAEHDPNSIAMLLTNSRKVAEAVKVEAQKQVKKIKRQAQIKLENIMIFITRSIGESVELANTVAPEHLSLMVGAPQKILEKIKNAGAVFLGPYSPVAVGDYIAGSNHVLPTGGTARFSSPLGVYDFIKRQSIIGYTKPALKAVQKEVRTLADIEGLDAHAKSVEIRFRS
jgi:histidinol dehydrogenase